MKLHLPKLLLSALLAVYCCASSTAEEKAPFDNLSYGGDFFASSYQFSFILDNVEANGNVVAAFWGNKATENLGANAFTLTANDNGATYILTTGRGKLGDTDIDADTTFVFGTNVIDSQEFAGSLQTGIVYTVTGTSTGGANASSTIDSIYIAPVTTGIYNANMNGNTSDLPGGVNSAYAVSTNSALIWAGTGDAAAWGTWVNASGQSVTETATTSNIYFDASTTVAKSLSISSAVNVNSINVYDNYTFDVAASVTAETIKIAANKTLTLDTALAQATISANVSGGTLAFNSGNWELSGQYTSDFTVGDSVSISLAEKAVVDLTSKEAQNYTSVLGKLKGDGTIVLKTTKSNYNTTFSFNEGFSGKVYVQEGNFAYNSALHGKILQLGTGVGVWLQDTGNMSNALVLDSGTHEMHVNNGNSFTLTANVTGEGVFQKKGAGTLYVKENASIANFDNSVGTTYLQGNATITNATVSGGTLDISEDFSGKINVSAGGLSTTKFVQDNKNAEFNAINTYTNITTSGTGYVLLNFGEYSIGSADGVSITKNYKVDGAFTINGKGYEHSEEKRTFTVGSEKSLTITGQLGVVTRAELLINGGSVVAGSLKLGHGEQQHASNGAYHGYLTMTSGSLTSGTISFGNDNHVNKVDITGGSVEFSEAAALTRGNNTGSTINITGTSAAAPVVLKATTIDWTLDGSGLTTAPTMGNIKVDAGNTHAITLKNVVLSGSVANNATLNLDGAVTLNSVSLSGNDVSLQEGARATVANMSDISSLLPQLTGTGTLVLTQNAFIAGAAKSTNTTTVYDFAGNIEVTGGVLRLGNDADDGGSAMNQMKMESATITLNGGGLRYFGGDSILGRIDVDASATLDVYATNDGETAQGTLTIKELDVASGKTLTLNGQWDKNVALGALTGDGELKITAAGAYNVGSMNIATLEAAKGDINFAAGQHEVNELDISSRDNSSVAQINLKEKAQLDVKTTLWMGSQASINLEDGASLTKGVVNIEGLSTENKATFKKATSGGATYSAESNDFIITGAAVSVKSDSTVTLGNNLQNSKVINAGVGELKLTHAGNVLSAIEALAGDINLESLKDQSLESLYIGDELTVNTNGATLSIQEAAINQQGARVTNVTFGDNAKLQGNLVLQSGASVSLGTDVQIDGTLTLGYGMELTGAQLEAIENLKNNADERVALFSNVDQLKLTDAATFSTNSVAVDYTGAQDLSNFFSNVDNGVYLLEFDQNVVYATLIPEPTTTTLSLLALAALAARRRRR